jgi:hypothetical protein
MMESGALLTGASRQTDENDKHSRDDATIQIIRADALTQTFRQRSLR